MVSIDESEVEKVAQMLDLVFASGEISDTVFRVNTLAEIYHSLESVPEGAVHPNPNGKICFIEQPYSPAPEDDPHNAWLKRFQMVRSEQNGVLSGLDIAIKDNTCIAGVEMTMGSQAFDGFAPAEHAEVVTRFLNEGGRLCGKTNMDEFAFGPTSETSAFGPTENPNASGHVTGGSSSGSAAAVAAGDVDVALGTDTGGSVRIPASYCGIVGIKPTFGLIPLHGVAELSYSMDHVGILAENVETAARGLEATADKKTRKAPFHESLGTDFEDLRIGVSERFFEEYVSTAVEKAVRDALGAMKDEGAEIVEVEIPALEYSREMWWGIAPVEFAGAYLTNSIGLWRRGRVARSLAAGIARGRSADSRHLGSNIKEMLTLGTYLLHEYDGRHYVQAQNLRDVLQRQFDDKFEQVDILAAPATPTTTLEIDGFERGVTPPVNWNTHPTNLTGHPSISIPCGEVDGLPVGLQFIGEWFADEFVLDVAHSYENDIT